MFLIQHSSWKWLDVWHEQHILPCQRSFWKSQSGIQRCPTSQRRIPQFYWTKKNPLWKQIKLLILTHKSNPTIDASQKTFSLSPIQYRYQTGQNTGNKHHCCVQSQLVNKHTRTKIKRSGEWVMCNMGLLSNGLLRHEFDFRHIKCSTPLYKVQIQIKLPWSLYTFSMSGIELSGWIDCGMKSLWVMKSPFL